MRAVDSGDSSAEPTPEKLPSVSLPSQQPPHGRRVFVLLDSEDQEAAPAGQLPPATTVVSSAPAAQEQEERIALGED